MDGVTVIEEHLVKDYTGCLVLAILSGLCSIFIMFCFIYTIKESIRLFFEPSDVLLAVLALAAGISCAVLCVFSAKEWSAKATHVEYTVTVDDTASFKEFNETYKILSEEDGVYRVGLKEASQ